MKKRTDPHRPGAIVPAHYRYVFSYNCATTDGGWPIPSCGINCELDRRVTNADGSVTNGAHDADGECCQIGLLQSGKTVKTGPGKCSVCGAHFVYGDVWEHEPTGEYIHLGHDCAAKYSMLADRSAWELADARARHNAAVQGLRAAKALRVAEFLDAHPGLSQAFEVEHEIIGDIKAKLREYGSISPKQIALVMRLADETRNPRAPEATVPAPIGKQSFRGTVVSTKAYDSDYGTQIKMTVKVTTPQGVWLAWGTAPAACLADSCNHGGLKGCEVEIKTTLKAGRDAHFAIMGRPRGKVLKLACGPDCYSCKRETQSVA